MRGGHHSAIAHRPRSSRGAQHALLFGLPRNRRAAWAIAAAAAVAIGAFALVLLYTDLSWEGVTAWIHRVNPVAALPLMALLPIIGFPISFVYLFAGARFGPIGGGFVVAVITAVHLVGTYLIANSFLRAALRRVIERRHRHLPEIPEDEQAAICVIASLVPGLPYVVRNYLLALAGVRLKYLLLVCLPIYVARSYVTILLGNMGADPDKTRIMILLAIDGLKAVICAFVIWRLRVHHRKFHGHEQPAHGSASDGLPPPNAAAK